MYFPAPGTFLVPGPGPKFVFTGPGPQFVFTGTGPQFVFTGPGTKFVFTSPGPQFEFTGPGPQFLFTGSNPQLVFTPNLYLPAQPGLSLDIPTLSPQLYLLALAYDLYAHRLHAKLIYPQ